MRKMEARLNAILAGKDEPRGPVEELAAAELCQFARDLPHTAARFYAAAFEHEPRLFEQPVEQYRYNAACAAARAAEGKGKDAATLSAADRASWRRKAREWISGELAFLAQQLKNGNPQQGTAVQKTLAHWQRDSDLAGVRESRSLAALPALDRNAWCRLWAEVAGLLRRAKRAG
jgi:hypothetical protein